MIPGNAGFGAVLDGKTIEGVKDFDSRRGGPLGTYRPFVTLLETNRRTLPEGYPNGKLVQPQLGGVLRGSSPAATVGFCNVATVGSWLLVVADRQKGGEEWMVVRMIFP